MEGDLVPLTVVSTAREADEVARILDAAGVPYQETLEGAEGGEERVCYLGTAFLVASADLERAKKLIP